MKKKQVNPWFPFWIDKWLFGSTRIELEPDERGVFVDLMSLSKKDDGYVRANEGVPYRDSQLSGLFNIEEELLQRTIKKCIKYGKTKKLKNGTLYMTSHEEYKLSDRHKRRIEDEMSEKADTMSEKADAKNRIEQKRIEKIKRIKGEELIVKEFEEFWKFYYQMGNKGDDPGDKEQAKKAYKILRRTETKGTVIKATNKYSDFLKHKEIKEGFKQKKMYGSTFLRSKKWKRFLAFEYKPSL